MIIRKNKKITFAFICWIISSYFLLIKATDFNPLINYFFFFLLFLSVIITSDVFINYVLKNKQQKTYIQIILKLFCSILIFIISVIFLIFIDDQLHNRLLNKYGIQTNAIVLESKDVEEPNGTDEVCGCIEQQLKIKYIVDSKNYQQQVIIEDFYDKGDTISIKYLPFEPNIFKTIEYGY